MKKEEDPESILMTLISMLSGSSLPSLTFSSLGIVWGARSGPQELAAWGAVSNSWKLRSAIVSKKELLYVIFMYWFLLHIMLLRALYFAFLHFSHTPFI